MPLFPMVRRSPLFLGTALAASACFSVPPDATPGAEGSSGTAAGATDTSTGGGTTTLPPGQTTSPSTTDAPDDTTSTTDGEESSDGADTTEGGSSGGAMGCADPGAPMGCNDGMVALGDVCFGLTADDVTVGDSPREIAVGDVDDDGNLDIAVADPVANEVRVYRGNGDGTFGNPVSVGGGGAAQLALGLINADTNLDLAILTNGSDYRVYTGDGTGGFSFAANGAVGAVGSDIEIADLDNDGDGDLVVPVWDAVHVLFGTGAGFNPPTVLALNGTVEGSEHIVVGPMQGNSVDLVSSFYDTNNVGVFLNPGNGNLALDSSNATGGGSDGPFDLEAGDFNGDGAMDIVATVEANDQVFILLNDGAGGLIDDIAPISGDVRHVATGDFDGDCIDDLAMARRVGNNYEVAFYASRADGDFDAPVVVPVNPQVEDLQLGDFNNDGLVDAVLSHGGQASPGITIIQTQP